MDRRNTIPLTLVGVLTLLTALAAVWAVISAAENATQAVQDATTATFGNPLGSNSFSMNLTSSVSAGHGTGTLTQVEQINYMPPDRMAVYKTQPKLSLLGRESKDAIRVDLLDYVAIIGGTTPWSGGGPHYDRTEPLTTFVARVNPKLGAQGRAVQGKVYETAVVHDDFLVYLEVNLDVPKQALDGGRLTAGGLQREIFQLLRINGSPAPAVGS